MDTMEERRNAIVNFINEKGSITFAQLEKNFSNVSQMTLRTDLKALDDAKRIVRVHGGAKSVDVVLGTDDYISRRATRNVEEKECIAKKILPLIKPNITVYLDSGSTTAILAKMWPNQPNFIFTNSIACILELSKLDKPKIFVPGGELNEYSMSLCGMQANESVKSVNFDLAIVGITSYSSDSGFSCGDLMESHLKQAVMQQAEEKIIPMDSSKLDKKSTFHICSLGEADRIVTDSHIPKAFMQECAKAGVKVL